MREISLRRIVIAVLATALAAAIAAGCTGRRHQDRFRWKELIAATIAKKQNSAGPVHLDLIRVMPFGWEKFYMFPPRTPIDDVEKTLGFKWRAATKTRIDERDDITLLVFVIGQTVEDYIEQPRDEGDFSRLRAGHSYSPREGYFECAEEKEDGRSVFYFVEAERYRKE